MATQPLKVKINGDASGLNKAMSSAQGKLKSFGSKLKGLGSSLQAIAIPMGLIGGAGVKMALDFDKSMTKIKALVGVAGDEVDKMGESARQMALATGISSQEAGDALFFITSAGLRGSDAMEALEIATKAAASGLGETKTIADLATSAMNAYGSDTLNATAATDVLTAAVREGKLESSELAGAMGGVIPIASNMGVEFHEVGAAMAAMSRTGTNAATGATQLTAILASLKKPTDQAVQALSNMGMSTDQVQQSLAEDGLMATLEMLKNRTQEFGVDISSIFPNIRALKGVMDLTGAGMEDAKGIFDSLSKSAGATSKAFDTTTKSASFQFQAALNGAKETLTSLGQQLLVAVVPAIQKAVGFIRNLYNRFRELNPTTQKLILAFGGIAVALPTIITLVGGLTTALSLLMSPIGLIAAGLAAVAYVIYKNWGEVLPVVVGLYNRFVDLYNSSTSLRTAIAAIGSVFKSVFIGAKAQIMQFVNIFKTMWKVIKEFSQKGFKGSFGDILQEGFDNGKKIATDAAEDIATEFSDSYSNALSSKLEHKTVEQVQGSLDNVVDKFKGFGNNLVNNLFTGGIGGGDSEEPTTEDQPSLLNQIVGSDEDEQLANEKVSRFLETMNNLGLSVDSIMSAIGDSLMGAFTAMLNGENFVKVLGNALKQIIKQLIAAALAALALSTILGGLGIGSFQGGGTGFKDIFGKLSGFGKFANGGIVSAPTMGLMGEYPGAKSNPEVIAPLDKLKNMIGNTGGAQQVQVGGSFEIRGQDLVVALERANSTRNRLI